MTQKILSLGFFRLTALGLLALIAAFSLWSFAQADGTTISMCVKHTGASYLIGTGFDNQTCKSNEQLLTFNVTGPQGPIGPQGPEGGSAKVYDANDELMGYVTSAPNGQVNGYTVEAFDKNTNTIEDINISVLGSFISPALQNVGGPYEIYYSSPDCSGQTYMNDIDVNDTMSGATLPGPQDSFFAIDRSLTPPTSISYHSFGLPAGCTQGDGTITSPFPVINATAIWDSYARPFHIGL